MSDLAAQRPLMPLFNQSPPLLDSSLLKLDLCAGAACLNWPAWRRQQRLLLQLNPRTWTLSWRSCCRRCWHWHTWTVSDPTWPPSRPSDASLHPKSVSLGVGFGLGGGGVNRQVTPSVSTTIESICLCGCVGASRCVYLHLCVGVCVCLWLSLSGVSRSFGVERRSNAFVLCCWICSLVSIKWLYNTSIWFFRTFPSEPKRLWYRLEGALDPVWASSAVEIIWKWHRRKAKAIYWRCKISKTHY